MELLASVVDAINVLTRVLINVNSERPDRDPVPQVSRPYQVTVAPADAATPVAASIGDLNAWLSEGD